MGSGQAAKMQLHQNIILGNMQIIGMQNSSIILVMQHAESRATLQWKYRVLTKS